MRATGILLAVLALAAPAGAASRHAEPCPASVYGRTVAIDRQVRVLVDDAGIYRTCLRATGRITRLFEEDGQYSEGFVRRIAGPFVAWELGHSPECKNMCPEGVTGSYISRVTDARTGKVRRIAEGRPASLLLRPSGNVAWVIGGAPDARLWTWAAAGTRRLADSGAITDVAIAGDKLTWRNGDTPRSTAFG